MRPGSLNVGSRARGSADTTIFVGKIASSVRAETVEALVRACGELKVRGRGTWYSGNGEEWVAASRCVLGGGRCWTVLDGAGRCWTVLDGAGPLPGSFPGAHSKTH